MTDVEELANRICGQNIFDIDGIIDIEYPPELNAFISKYKSSSLGHENASISATLTR